MERVTVDTAELADMDGLECKLGGKIIRAHVLGEQAVVEVQPAAALDWYVNVWNCQATIMAGGEPLDPGDYDAELYDDLCWHVMESLGGAINMSGQYYPQDDEARAMFERLLASKRGTTGETMQLYVKATSNYPPGLPLQTLERLGPEWSGDRLLLPFGEGDEARTLEVVGWTDLFGGSPCPVHVVRARWLPQPTPAAQQVADGPNQPLEGFLVYGGNSGVRILDDEAEPTPGVDDHLPLGYGRPLVWVEDAADLPAEVRDVVERCGACEERAAAE